MRFYDCVTAPSPRRVRIFLAEKGITLETVQIDIRGGEHFGDAFRAVNAQTTVPVLELDDGTRLLDAHSICLYLDEVFPDHNLTGRDARERALVAMWQKEVDFNGLLAVAECYRNSAERLRSRAMPGPVDYEQIPALAERGRRRVRHFFGELDARLGRSSHVACDRFTVADITAFVAVQFARVIGEGVPEGHADLSRWYDAVLSRPSAAC